MERDIVEVLDCIATNADAGDWMQREAARAAAEIRRLRAIVESKPTVVTPDHLSRISAIAADLSTACREAAEAAKENTSGA